MNTCHRCGNTEAVYFTETYNPDVQVPFTMWLCPDCHQHLLELLDGFLEGEL